MQKSQITFAPVSFYTLRKQKTPIDQQANDEPPPVLTKGSETEFDNGEEPPPPLLEAETATNNDDRFATLNGSALSDGVTFEARTSTTNVDRTKSADEAGDPGAPIEPFFLESRHLPSWIRHCPKCSASQNIEVLFRGRIAGVLQSGPIISIECALCNTSIYNSCRRWEWPSASFAVEDHRIESVGCNFSELKPSTSSTMAIGGDASTDETQTITAIGDVAFNENYSHQFGMSFPVMFEMQNGHASGHCERITFRGFVYCHISRQVRTRGGGDSVSHWRCQQRIGSTCSGLVRLEGKNLMVVKGHKHLPDYAATRAILSDVHGEYTRLNLVSGRGVGTRRSVTETSSSRGPTLSTIILRPATDRGVIRKVTGQTERRRNASTDEPTTMETDELIRSITSRKELLTVKVSPST